MTMKVLLHICCGPCACYTVKALREEDMDVTGFWYNPNIHPLTENRQRLKTLQEYAQQVELPLIERDEYALQEWLRNVSFREHMRCRICYVMRLRAVAQMARRHNFDAFSTTLLYSKFQKHEEIIDTADRVSEEFGVPFLYRDFRRGWKEGIELSKKMELYRQQYCGCIYSEFERYQYAGRPKKKK